MIQRNERKLWKITHSLLSHPNGRGTAAEEQLLRAALAEPHRVWGCRMGSAEQCSCGWAVDADHQEGSIPTSTTPHRSPRQNPAFSHGFTGDKSHGFQKNKRSYQQNYTLFLLGFFFFFFFIVGFTWMYCNLKRSGRTTCKRLSK